MGVNELDCVITDLCRQIREGKDEITRLREENARLWAALKPFSTHSDFPSYFDDGAVLPISVSVGDLRAAAAALKETNNGTV